MKSRFVPFSVILLAASAALLTIFWFVGETRASVTIPDLRGLGDLAGLDSTPIVTGMQPSSAPNDLDTPVVISGTGFTAGLSGTLVVTSPTAYLGSTMLEDVAWADSTALRTTVPWGMEPGVYTLRVENPDGGVGSLPNAFTVTQGIGVWASGGPYGGVIGNVVLHPTNSARVYATAEGSGLFVSDDSGEHWRLLLIYRIVKRPAIDTQQPEVIYIGVGNSVLRSEDGGSSWNHIVPPQVPTSDHAYEMKAFAHPAISGTVYLAVWGYFDEGTGVYKSDDRGETWVALTAGLTDTQVSSLAFDPLNPQQMYAVTMNGNVFSSADGGKNWDFGAQVIINTGEVFVKRVYVNPFGAQEVWFVDEGSGRVFKSNPPSLAQWEPVTTTIGVQSLTFHPTISGTIWAAGGAGLVSTDDGQTWQPAGSGLWPGSQYTHGVKNFAVDAITNPATPVLYAGTGRGMYKSVDGGLSWFESNQDLSGVVVWKLAVSPHDPQELYASTASRGALWSSNGGRSWLELDMPQPGWFADLAVDPITPTRVYFTGEDGSSGTLLPVVRISDDRGASWHTRVLSIPHALQAQGWHGRAYALAADPSQPGHLLAGIGLYPAGWPGGWVGPRGGLYLSQDYGEHWQMIQPTVPISHVAVIVYDPVDPQIVYAGTRGGTLLKSVDSGLTWQSIYTWSGIPDIVTIAVHPTHHEIVLAGLMESARGIPGGEDGLFRSADGGHSWELMSEGSWVWVLAYDAHDPPFLYAGSGGLWRSADNGLTWKVAAGLSQGDVESLVTTTDGERVIIYAGITGGAVAQPGWMGMTQGGNTTLLGSGVFRLTIILPPPRLYLPLVIRSSAP